MAKKTPSSTGAPAAPRPNSASAGNKAAAPAAASPYLSKSAAAQATKRPSGRSTIQRLGIYLVSAVLSAAA